MVDSPQAEAPTSKIKEIQKQETVPLSKLPTSSGSMKTIPKVATRSGGGPAVNAPRTPAGNSSSSLQKFTTPEALLNAKCDGCARPLLMQDMRGRIVTVPKSCITCDTDEVNGMASNHVKEIQVERYHHACFRCTTCGDHFGELDGRANFVREDGKAVHVSVSD